MEQNTFRSTQHWQEFPDCEDVFGGNLAIVPNSELKEHPIHFAYEFYFIFIIQVSSFVYCKVKTPPAIYDFRSSCRLWPSCS